MRLELAWNQMGGPWNSIRFAGAHCDRSATSPARALDLMSLGFALTEGSGQIAGCHQDLARVLLGLIGVELVWRLPVAPTLE